MRTVLVVVVALMVGGAADVQAKVDRHTQDAPPKEVPRTAWEGMERVGRRWVREFTAMQHEVLVTGSGRVGAQVGHVWMVPEAAVLPGAGLALRYRGIWRKRFFVGVEMAGNAGADEEGEPFGGYRAMAMGGMRWLRTRWLSGQTEVHGGLSSFSLIPLPRVGVGHSVALNLLPRRWPVTAELGVNANTDILLVAPAVGAGVFAGLSLQVWKVTLGMELGTSGEVLVAAVANSAAANVYGRAMVGLVL